MAAGQINDSILNLRPDVKASRELSAPVSSQAAACFRLFDTCMARAANVDAQRQSCIEDQMARFSLWTSNMAVFARSKLSLDHRLRWTPQVRDLVTSLLGLLENDIQQLLSILEHLGLSGLSIPDRNQLLATGDFERALLAISNELTLLNELSNTIRRANRKTQDEKALGQFTLIDTDGNDIEGALQEAWANNILDRFPGCSEVIRIRLARSMVLRRKKIVYRRDRYSSDPFRILQTTDKPTLQPQSHCEGQNQRQLEGQETQLELVGKSRSAIASTSIRSATTLALPDFQKAQTPSVVSKSRTIALDSHEQLVFPRPPGKLLENNPYYTLREPRHTQGYIRSEQKWREHVIGDLEAYICLFNECDQPERTWTHSEGWLKHMLQHALQWKCPARPHRGQIFMTQEEFQKHLEQDHKKKYTDAELALVTNRSRQKSGPLFSSCPLCGQDVQQAGGNLEKHIAGHLRSLALRSLPPVYNEVDEDENDAKNSNGVISNRTTIKEITTTGSQVSLRSPTKTILGEYEVSDAAFSFLHIPQAPTVLSCHPSDGEFGTHVYIKLSSQHDLFLLSTPMPTWSLMFGSEKRSAKSVLRDLQDNFIYSCEGYAPRFTATNCASSLVPLQVVCDDPSGSEILRIPIGTFQYLDGPDDDQARMAKLAKIEYEDLIPLPTSSSPKADRTIHVAQPADEDTNSSIQGDGDDSKIDEDEPKYCYCNEVSYGEMIACDADECPREWFHLECVGLKVAPKSEGKLLQEQPNQTSAANRTSATWYCEECKERLENRRQTMLWRTENRPLM
ncbi:unnamed protein product [Fusarium venenatum]|uniref:PHD-type domain-containing protein n=1 Tax=Fusarium venenatum TaxID=56646 RepID=A0A2L2TBE1_9HYPO|nr:uncharacterized protein FVRRES_04692 [Fusarium venenatum]CEI60256.1 unnamed protein product [Fusarium venenatum]